MLFGDKGVALNNDTTHNTLTIQGNSFTGSGPNAEMGMVPKPPTTAGTTKYLREDGTWETPPDTNTTYSLNFSDDAGAVIALKDNNNISQGQAMIIGTNGINVGYATNPNEIRINGLNLAPKASPTLTGTPSAPTASIGTNTTQIATTAFIKNEIEDKVNNIYLNNDAKKIGQITEGTNSASLYKIILSDTIKNDSAHSSGGSRTYKFVISTESNLNTKNLTNVVNIDCFLKSKNHDNTNNRMIYYLEKPTKILYYNKDDPDPDEAQPIRLVVGSDLDSWIQNGGEAEAILTIEYLHE